jgi:hypothetical protein
MGSTSRPFDIRKSSFDIPTAGFFGCDGNRHQLVCLVHQFLNRPRISNIEFLQHFELEHGLVGLFLYDSELCNEGFSRLPTTGGAVVGRDRRGRPHELTLYDPAGRPIRQPVAKPEYVQRKPLRPILKITFVG